MTILLATDFSLVSELASEVAAELARALRTPLHVVHVSEDPRAPFVLGTPEARILNDEHRALAEVAERLVRAGTEQVTTELGAGVIEETLGAIAERHLADLVVIGLEPLATRSSGGLSERLIRTIKAPVLAVSSVDGLRAFLRGERPLRVLLGSDLNRAATQAEEALSVFARAGELSVEVVWVTSVREGQFRYGLPEAADAALEAMLRPLVSRDLELQGESFPWREKRRVRVLFSERSATDELVELASNADLVVLGARSRSWISRALSGSTARGLLRGSPTSVLCAPAKRNSTAVVPGRGFRRVVAATDFSSQGDAALPLAFSLLPTGGEVHFVHVLPGAQYDRPGERAAARSELERRVPRESPGPTVQTEVLAGQVEEALLLYARRVGADALCVGSHGHSPLASRTLGSTSGALLARSELPVLVVPPIPE